MTAYQNMKLQILDLLNLSKDAAHIHIGMCVIFVTALVWKKGRIEGVCLLPVLGTALLMEVLDLKDDMNTYGYFRWSASIHDFINTMFWPSILVCLSRFFNISRDSVD